ncbi:MAG TPA: hypothetical protein VGF17_02340, partial [Phytomonospora sp.]
MGRVLRKILRPLTTGIDRRADRVAERAVRTRAATLVDGAAAELRLRNARGMDELYDVVAGL